MELPRTREAIEPWAERLMAGCLNEDARRLVAAAAAEYMAVFDAIDRHHEALRALEDAAASMDPDDDASRVAVKVAAMRLKACPGEVEVRAKLMPIVVQLIAKAQAANRGEADASIVQLRKFAEQRERLMADFGPASKIKPKASKGEEG